MKTKMQMALASFEGCKNFEELKTKLQIVAENYGFSGFNFLDIGNPQYDIPFYQGTSGKSWEEDYKSNLFVRVDPCLSRARRTNTPFAWSEVPPVPRIGKRKPGGLEVMEAAQDHGFTDGLVIPYHFVDPVGRVYSSLVVFFWKEKVPDFRAMMKENQTELHIIMVYWAQHAIDMVEEQFRQKPTLINRAGENDNEYLITDKEREVLSWAAMGKTNADTADIMKIATSTVDTHIKSVLKKLQAANKTHAVSKAIYLGLIDI